MLEKIEYLHEFYYILMDIIFQNYERALFRLEKIDKSVLPKTFSILYDKANSIINYHLGRKMNDFEVLSLKGIHFNHILYDDDIWLERLLCEHESYISGLERYSILKYREDINFLSLIEEVQEKIKKINPRFYNFMNSYSIVLDYPIGYNREKEIYGIVVETPIHSDRITRIALSDYSEEFDAEGLSTDKSLRKRLNLF